MPKNDALLTTAKTEAERYFLESIMRLENPAVLLKKDEEGTIIAVYVSELFAKMMECDVDTAFELVDGTNYINTTHQDDRVYVKRMLRRHVGEDGTRQLKIRKYTAKGNMISCLVCYSFIDDYDEHYIYCTYDDISKMQEYEDWLRFGYSSTGDSFYRAGENTLTLIRANLNTDMIEDIQGRDTFGTDSPVHRYSEVINKRAVHYPIYEEKADFLDTFSTEALRNAHDSGIYFITRIYYSQRGMGKCCFVKYSVDLRRHPVTGNVIAFITEEQCNAEKLLASLSDNILVKQFEFIAYISSGNYGVVIGNNDYVTVGSLFPLTKTGEYMHYLTSQVFMYMSGDDEAKNKWKKALLPETIAEKLKLDNSYTIEITISDNGAIYYKRFSFYRVEPEADFYVMVLHDTTDIRREHLEFNRQLNKALDDAEHANMVKMAFLSRMSNEIMTPMNKIMSLYKKALNDANLTPVLKEEIEDIGDNARYLMSIFKDIINMSDIEIGRIKLEKIDFDFKEFIEGFNENAILKCKEKGITYSCEVEGKLHDNYCGDIAKLSQMLSGIVDNAVKFNKSGGSITMNVRQTAQFEDQAVLQFIIDDNGCGISKDYLPKVFDTFSKEDDNESGIGLGLPLAKNIAMLMKGDIDVRSEEGKGTSVTVEVTLECVDDRETIKSDEDMKNVLDGKHILLAEDMVINAEMMKQMLVVNGVEVVCAENGKRAVEIFKDSDMDYFDAVLMDVRMPEMDGLAATKAIRALERMDAKDVPIIALTANSFDEDIKRSFDAGMNEHLSKPVNPDILYKTLAKKIKEREENFI